MTDAFVFPPPPRPSVAVAGDARFDAHGFQQHGHADSRVPIVVDDENAVRNGVPGRRLRLALPGGERPGQRQTHHEARPLPLSAALRLDLAAMQRQLSALSSRPGATPQERELLAGLEARIAAAISQERTEREPAEQEPAERGAVVESAEE